jgi:hypothetical protein
MYGPHLMGVGAGGEQWCTASAAAMKKYCRIYDSGDHPQGIDLADYNSLIIRAFINAISPCPSEGLPRHDYQFPKKAQGANSPDLLGVMAEDTVKIIEHNWTMKTLRKMYEFARIMRCTIVKDQVVDQPCDNYAKHFESNTESDFHVEVAWMNDLDPETDAPLLRMLVDIMIDQQLDANPHAKHIPIPTGTKPHVAALVGQHASGAYSALSSTSNAEQRAVYHFHGADEACYESHIDVPRTSELISEFYAHITSAAPAHHDRALAALPRDSQINIVARARQWKYRQQVQWSHKQEESVAHSLLILEKAEEDRRNGIKINQQLRDVRNDHAEIVDQTQWQFHVAWKCFEGDCGDCEHEKEREGNSVVNLLPVEAMAEAQGLSDSE